MAARPELRPYSSAIFNGHLSSPSAHSSPFCAVEELHRSSKGRRLAAICLRRQTAHSKAHKARQVLSLKSSICPAAVMGSKAATLVSEACKLPLMSVKTCCISTSNQLILKCLSEAGTDRSGWLFMHKVHYSCSHTPASGHVHDCTPEQGAAFHKRWAISFAVNSTNLSFQVGLSCTGWLIREM